MAAIFFSLNVIANGEPPNEGLIFSRARSFSSDGYAAVEVSGKWGFINTDGAFVLEPKWKTVGDLAGGVAFVNNEGESLYHCVDLKGQQKGGKVAHIIDTSWTFAQKMYPVYTERGGACITRDGRFAIGPLKNIRVGRFSEGLARIHNMETDNYGYIDESGKQVVTPVWDIAADFSEGFARVSNGDMWGYIDRGGRVAIPLEWDFAGKFSEGLAPVERIIRGEKKCGFIDQKGVLRLPLKWDSAGSFSEGLANIKLGGKWGFIDSNGDYVIEDSGGFATGFSEGLARFRKGDKYGFIDKKGVVRIPPMWDDADDFSNGYALVYRLVEGKDRYGFVDTKGNMLAVGLERGLDSSQVEYDRFVELMKKSDLEAKKGKYESASDSAYEAIQIVDRMFELQGLSESEKRTKSADLQALLAFRTYKALEPVIERKSYDKDGLSERWVKRIERLPAFDPADCDDQTAAKTSASTAGFLNLILTEDLIRTKKFELAATTYSEAKVYFEKGRGSRAAANFDDEKLRAKMKELGESIASRGLRSGAYVQNSGTLLLWIAQVSSVTEDIIKVRITYAASGSTSKTRSNFTKGKEYELPRKQVKLLVRPSFDAMRKGFR